MSDTPISDSTPHTVGDLGMLCRMLERQLNESNVEIEEKRKDVVYLATEKAKLEEQIKRLRKANFQLREGAEEQKQRIQRLEEVGDWMRYNSNNEWWCGNWDKAKEAKP